MSADVDPRTLLGEWRFSRTVDDRIAGDVVRVEGTTTLTLEDAGLAGTAIRWAEEGVMRRGDLELPVTRVLHLVPEADGWAVTFEDGRDFHPWAPGEEVVHLCGVDTYRGRIELEAGGAGTPGPEATSQVTRPASWMVTWRVTGPAKDYEMVTRLSRAGGPDLLRFRPS